MSKILYKKSIIHINNVKEPAITGPVMAIFTKNINVFNQRLIERLSRPLPPELHLVLRFAGRDAYTNIMKIEDIPKIKC